MLHGCIVRRALNARGLEKRESLNLSAWRDKKVSQRRIIHLDPLRYCNPAVLMSVLIITPLLGFLNRLLKPIEYKWRTFFVNN